MEDPYLPNLNIEDIKLCFRRAMTGEYGEVYNIDPNIILTWLKTYWRGRLVAAERVTMREHQEEMSKPINRDAAWRKAVEELTKHMKERRHGHAK